MVRTQDPFQIPKAGLEIAPIAGLASINVNGSVGPVPATEFVGESTLGGMVVYAIYQALLTGLRTEAMRRRGELNRAGNTPDGQQSASHSVTAAAGSSGLAARGGRSWACSCPILSLRSIAVTGIWADLRVSVESLGVIYAQNAPRALTLRQVQPVS